MNDQDAYDSLADLYDLLQQDIDPVQWADYIESLEQAYSRRLTTGDGEGGRPILVDLGCGTGSLCLEMARRGYDLIGIDRSQDMLEQARRKCEAAGNDLVRSRCLFLEQDITRFELFGTVDIIVCLLDTLNHLTQPGQVQALFHLCANYLNPGGLLIFDLATARHLAQTLGDNLFFEDCEHYSLFWQNHFDRSSDTSRSELTLFRKAANGLYTRIDETIHEKLYLDSDIRRWLDEAGLELAACLGDLSHNKADAAAERHFYVVRKPIPPQGEND